MAILLNMSKKTAHKYVCIQTLFQGEEKTSFQNSSWGNARNLVFETCKGIAQGLFRSYFAEHTSSSYDINTCLLTLCLLLLLTRLESACCVLVEKKVNLLLIRSKVGQTCTECPTSPHYECNPDKYGRTGTMNNTLPSTSLLCGNGQHTKHYNDIIANCMSYFLESADYAETKE